MGSLTFKYSLSAAAILMLVLYLSFPANIFAAPELSPCDKVASLASSMNLAKELEDRIDAARIFGAQDVILGTFHAKSPARISLFKAEQDLDDLKWLISTYRQAPGCSM